MKIGFIGAGNMGGAILKGIANDKKYEIAIYEKSAERAEIMAKSTGASVKESVASLVDFAEVILVAVKPVHIDSLIKEISECKDYAKKVFISIAAGVKVERFTNVLGEIALVRTMPNLPAMVQEGLTGIYYHNMDDGKYEAVRNEIKDIFDACGKTVILPNEGAVDKIISVTSSSPAYICLVIDALADGAVRAGFSRADAYVMAEQTVFGTAKYLVETGTLPSVLKDQVCSPAGSTIEAVVALEKSGLRSAILDAMDASEKKAPGKM